MQKMLTMAVAVALCAMAAGPAWAVEYTRDGRVIVESATYDGPGWTWEDAVGVGATGTGLAILTVMSEAGAHAVAPAAFITWGAWRTAQYRPQDVKDAIHANLADQRAEARPGTVGHMLGN